MTYRWLLPDHLEDLLPEAAWCLEGARRLLLDTLRGRGYQLVIPPLVEFVESLAVEEGQDLGPLTFSLVDPLCGRQLGLRPDMTLQAARIDAHGMNHQGVNRLCYAGPVVHTHPEAPARSREPFQVGAELYGVAGLEGDLEILNLLLTCLEQLGLNDVRVDVGQVALFRRMVEQAGLSRRQTAQVTEILQQRDVPSLKRWAHALPAPWNWRFSALGGLDGPPGKVLDAARQALAGWADLESVLAPLDAVRQHLPAHTALSFDLAELRGVHYHSGLVFAVYCPGFAEAIARGGRYDDIGESFGQARPAVGFSLDLKALLPRLKTFQ